MHLQFAIRMGSIDSRFISLKYPLLLWVLRSPPSIEYCPFYDFFWEYFTIQLSSQSLVTIPGRVEDLHPSIQLSVLQEYSYSLEIIYEMGMGKVHRIILKLFDNYLLSIPGPRPFPIPRNESNYLLRSSRVKPIHFVLITFPGVPTICPARRRTHKPELWLNAIYADGRAKPQIAIAYERIA